MKGFIKFRYYASVLIVAGLLVGCGGGGGTDKSSTIIDNENTHENNQEANEIKSIFVNAVKKDSWVLTAVDQNDLYYSFFAEKDNEGKLLHYKQLVLDKRDSKGDFSHHLTMNFDQFGRPITMTMPKAKGEMIFDYVSKSKIDVTIKLDDGTSKKVTVNNLFSNSASRPFVPSANSSTRAIDRLQREYSIDDEWSAGGKIQGCKDNKEQPSVIIKKKLPQEMLVSQPQLAIIKPTINPPDAEFSFYWYSYTLPGLEAYDDWYWNCAWNYTGGLVTGFVTKKAGQAVGVIEKLYQFGSSIINDIDVKANEKSEDKTINYVIDTIGDEVLPIWSFLRKLKDLGKLPIDAKNGPCSVKIYNYLNQIQTADEEVKVTLKGVTKKKSFSPIPKWQEIFWVVDAPNFDFSDNCATPKACPKAYDASLDDDKDHIIIHGNYRKDYLFCRYYKTGQLKDEAPFANGKASGIVKTFYKSGQLASERPNIAGKAHGVSKYYYESGTLRIEDPYINNRRHGVRKTYHKSGLLSSITPYTRGEIHGLKKYYDQNGKLTIEQPYIKGVKNGISKRFHESGQVSEETPYVNGKKHGVSMTYNPSGQLTSETPYVNGKEHGIHMNYDSSGLTYEIPYINGKRHGNAQRYINGKLYACTTFINDKNVGSCMP